MYPPPPVRIDTIDSIDMLHPHACIALMVDSIDALIRIDTIDSIVCTLV